MKNIRYYLSNIRLIKDETQKQMAEKLSMSSTALSFIENEAKPVEASFIEKLFNVYPDLKGIEKQKILGYYLHKKEEEFNKEKQEVAKKITKIESLIKISNSNSSSKFNFILGELKKLEQKK